jgi:hypothetical protein
VLAFAGCVHPTVMECWRDAGVAALLSLPLLLLLPREPLWVPRVYPEFRIQWRAILGAAMAILVCFLLAKYGMALIVRLV